jgi:hypothetical protein
MKPNEFPFEAIDTLTFRVQKRPLAVSLRPLYRITLLLLVLDLNCSARTASHLKLQFFNWALKNPPLQSSLRERFQAKTRLVLDFIHLDPVVNLALRYALAEDLVSMTNKDKYRLTEKGQQLVSRVKGARSPLLAEEIQFLESVGQRVSEVKLRGGLR